MPLIKLATAARRARMGSVTAITRALRAAGIPLVSLSPGVWAVEEADLDRFLRNREDAPAEPPRPKPAWRPPAAGAPASKPKKKRRA